MHIKKIERAGGSVTVVADGFLLVDQLRVYSTTDLRIRIVPGAASASVPAPLSAAGSAKVSATDTAALRRALADTQRDVVVDIPGGGAGLVRAVPWSMLGSGSAAFMEQYGVKYPLYTGAMAKGIASADLVIAAGEKGMLASLGAGGLPLHRVSAALDKIQAALPNGPYAVNLIHAPADELLESGGVELFLKRGVRVVEASAFMKLTPWIVRYRVAGLERSASGRTVCRNKVIFKVSRTELASPAMLPPPADIVAKLLAKGLVTAEQAALAPGVTMCDDVAVECDSGGHTDNRPLAPLFAAIQAVRDEAVTQHRYIRPIRLGAAGGIGTPQAAGRLAGENGFGATYNGESETLEQIRALCKKFAVPVGAAALQFPLAHPRVATVIPGAASAAEVAQNKAYVDMKIPGGLWRGLKEAGVLRADAPTPADPGGKL